jgi:signal transduction histidine kinase
LPAGIELTAYRIIQEALTNVVKHAGAPHCVVSIRYGDADLVIEIVDQGRGAAEPLHAGGHGLIGMRERVSVYGGQLTVGPLPQRGFRVAARIPITLARAT